MFWGEDQNTIDEKGRITVPARWRPRLADGFFVCPGLDPCLFILPPERWTQVQEKLAAASLGTKEAEELQRHFGTGSEAKLDRYGRVLIPPKLRDRARLSGEVLLCGAFNRIEIWNPEHRRQYDEGAQVEEGPREATLREAIKTLSIHL
jgi:MraZ protein